MVAAGGSMGSRLCPILVLERAKRHVGKPLASEITHIAAAGCIRSCTPVLQKAIRNTDRMHRPNVAWWRSF